MASEQVRFEVFRGYLSTWHALFSHAADFASQVGRDRVISISHSEDNSKGIVTVWYWADGADESEREPADDFIRDGEDAVEWRPGQQQEPQ